MKIDYAKRRRVMERSRRLGHCICDPKRPCPCDVFTEQGICPCAGERPDPVDPATIRLTELVRNTGCASKIAPTDLEGVLSRLPEVDDPAVIAGLAASDDAGVYQISEGTRLVQTIDVMTPCVDEAELFGRICAANCLSDVYAMGGVPRTALSLVAFDTDGLHTELMYLQLKGAMETFAAAGVALLGGHSIKDTEPKLGFAITGTMDAAADAVLQGAAQADDVLVLTKPLGVGTLNFARQIGRADEAALVEMQDWMAALNKGAAEAMMAVGVHACTDITGFGLFGHLIEMLRQSDATARIDAGDLPAMTGALQAIRDDILPGAMERNREYVAEDIEVLDGVDPALVHLGFDAQTSGGLLIAVAAEKHQSLLAELAARGVGQAWTVGRIEAVGTGGKIVVGPGRLSDGQVAARRAAAQERDMSQEATPAPAVPPAEPDMEEREPCCCAECSDIGSPAATGTSVESGPAAASTSPESMRAFGALMRSIGQPGCLDARTKELVNFALVLLARCEPCIAHHVKHAAEMGISRAELDEIAWCATAMGGAPVKMFYGEQMALLEGR